MTGASVGGRGGGQISNEELHDFIFPAGREALLRPGTIVHTDSAGAYRNLGFYGAVSSTPRRTRSHSG